MLPPPYASLSNRVSIEHVIICRDNHCLVFMTNRGGAAENNRKNLNTKVACRKCELSSLIYKRISLKLYFNVFDQTAWCLLRLDYVWVTRWPSNFSSSMYLKLGNTRYSSMISYCLLNALICEVLDPFLFFWKKWKNCVENIADKHTCVS